MKANVYNIKIPPFDYYLHVCIGLTYNDSIKFSEQQFDMYLGDHYDGEACVLTREDNRVIVVLPKDAPIQDIYHESLHATWYVCNNIGIGLTCENHEIQAYMQTYIVDNIIKKINSFKKCVGADQE